MIHAASRRTNAFVPTMACAVLLFAGAGLGTAHADASEAAEIAAVHSAGIAPMDAVSRAEKHSGGRAFGMGLEVARRGTWYEVQLDVHGKPMLARIDPQSGSWLGIAPAHGEDAQGMLSLKGRKLSLNQAIAAAEHAGHGRALEAGPYGHGKAAHYDVDVVSQSNHVAHFSVDPDTGRVSTAPASEVD
ncbi:PepSY domain-containing protein [Dyella sp. A6]|uniref:PepSY domain-containing protein n=1 Tax=Dyella aluminiiresistens TaxID=3069105 RepID=UPI002E76EDF0|nr:PepSY domain-containing protein [Dyella sp. A6]